MSPATENQTQAPIEIQVQYFAVLAEHAGKTRELLKISHTSIPQLYAELQQRYRFTHQLEDIRVAINSSYAPVTQPLVGGDTVVFITPVAGG